MIKVKFDYTFLGETTKVVATAKDVDAYGAIGLKIRFVDKSGEQIEMPFDVSCFEDISELASELMYEKKYTSELEF